MWSPPSSLWTLSIFSSDPARVELLENFSLSIEQLRGEISGFASFLELVFLCAATWRVNLFLKGCCWIGWFRWSLPGLQLSLSLPLSLLASSWTERKRGDRERRVISSLMKRGWKPFGALWKGGFEPPLRVKPRFQGERACLVPRVQLTINAMLAVIHSGNEWVRRRVAKLTNFIEPRDILAIYSLATSICMCKFGRRETSLWSRSCTVRKIRTAPSFRAVYFGGSVMRWDLIGWDSIRNSARTEKLADNRYRLFMWWNMYIAHLIANAMTMNQSMFSLIFFLNNKIFF